MKILKLDRIHILIFLSLVFYLLFLYLTQREWVFGGEMWAEAATNYFMNAQSSDWKTVFFSTDAGYIPLPNRILAFAFHKFGFGASLTAYAYNWSAVMIPWMCVSVFIFNPKIEKGEKLKAFATGLSKS